MTRYTIKALTRDAGSQFLPGIARTDTIEESLTKE